MRKLIRFRWQEGPFVSGVAILLMIDALVFAWSTATRWPTVLFFLIMVGLAICLGPASWLDDLLKDRRRS